MRNTDKIKHDKQILRLKDELRAYKSKYKEAVKLLNRTERDFGTAKDIEGVFETHSIKPSNGNGKSEATAFIIASDWHIEERVTREQTSGLNSYSLKVAKKRADKFFQSSLKLLQMSQRDVRIDNVVLGLLGDFISGSIHDELMESNAILPTEAVLLAQSWLASGIDFLLENTEVNFVIPCISGNHGRFTAKQRHANAYGNSLETFMYQALAQRYESNPRVKFIISRGYHTYLKVYNKTIRFHHGHAIRSLGGIGGVAPALLRAVAQWNRGTKADLDVMGHLHQFKDFGSAMINGSLIGYNAYALAIKAEYEPPRQLFFLMDRDRGKTIVAPICV